MLCMAHLRGVESALSSHSTRPVILSRLSVTTEAAIQA